MKDKKYHQSHEEWVKSLKCHNACMDIVGRCALFSFLTEISMDGYEVVSVFEQRQTLFFNPEKNIYTIIYKKLIK